jgi:hypothetical protein
MNVPTITPIRQFTLDDLAPRERARVTIDPESGCWVASGPLDKDGYAKRGNEMLHRYVYRTLVAPIPAGCEIDHVAKLGCIHRNCIWVSHLEPVSHRINVLRGTSFAAINAAKDECIHGHPFDLLNTIWRPGRRDCKQCRADRAAAKRLAASQPGLRLAA